MKKKGQRLQETEGQEKEFDNKWCIVLRSQMIRDVKRDI